MYFRSPFLPKLNTILPCLTKEKSTHWLTNHKHRLRLYNILIQVYRFADENTVLHTIKTIKQFRL